MDGDAVACTWPPSIDSPQSPTSGARRESEGYPTEDSRWACRESARARQVARLGARCGVGFPQNSRKLRRCHAITVSGLTMGTADRQPRHERESYTHSRRSAAVRRRRGRRDRWTTRAGSERDVFPAARRATGPGSEGIEGARDDDRRHDCRLSENTCNSIAATHTKFSVGTGRDGAAGCYGD